MFLSSADLSGIPSKCQTVWIKPGPNCLQTLSIDDTSTCRQRIKKKNIKIPELCIYMLCLCERLFICALWSPAGKRLTSWLSFGVFNCEFVTFPLVSWVRCGT